MCVRARHLKFKYKRSSEMAGYACACFELNAISRSHGGVPSDRTLIHNRDRGLLGLHILDICLEI